MEDQQNNPTQPGQVMDVQSPKPADSLATNPTNVPVSEASVANNPVMSQEPTTNPDLSNTQANIPVPKKKKGPGLVIGVALVVLVLLVGGVVMAYLKTKKPAPTNSSTTQKTVPVKAADIDATNAELDSSLKKVNETTDFSATDLSDTTLGL